MPKFSGKELIDKAVDIVTRHPDGIRVTDIVAELQNAGAENSLGSIQSTLSGNLATDSRVQKVSWGLYKPAGSETTNVIDSPTAPPAQTHGLVEEDFYRSFADWLRDELEEVSEAEALGGAGLRKKWATPDVVGIRKSATYEVIKFETEILSAEVKISDIFTALGQAAAYRLFSHKTYIVVPGSSPQEELDRLESLTLLLGIGLVTFRLDKSAPDYKLHVRAQRFTPDMFYANDFANRLRNHAPETFNKLFR